MPELDTDQKISAPIVLHLNKKENRKRRYSKDLEEIQQVERQFARTTHRIVRAGEKGISSYRKLSAKSAKKKKDGAIRDFIPNTGTAMSRTLREVSSLPEDIAQIANTKQNRKRLKRQLRSLSRTLRVWRW